MTTNERRSIPTRYNGTRFRSKLEADWARTFDALGVRWEYEPEGQYYGSVFYYPDFWLPRSRQWVEVKGVFEPADCRKIHALITHVPPRPHTDDETCPDIPIVACVPDGAFYGWERGDDAVTWATFLTERARAVELCECLRCRGWWFCDPDLSWRCQCCGSYDGARHIGHRLHSPLTAAQWAPVAFERDLDIAVHRSADGYVRGDSRATALELYAEKLTGARDWRFPDPSTRAS